MLGTNKKKEKEMKKGLTEQQKLKIAIRRLRYLSKYNIGDNLVDGIHRTLNRIVKEKGIKK